MNARIAPITVMPKFVTLDNNMDKIGVLEIIVISNIHDQKTAQICNQFLAFNDIDLVRNGYFGLAASGNMGLVLSKGKNIIFPNNYVLYLCYLMSIFGIDNLELIYCNFSVIKERGLPDDSDFISEEIINLKNSLNSYGYVENQMPLSCYVFPSYLLKNEQFDPCMRAYENWDFLRAIFDKKMPHHIPVLDPRIYEVPDDTTDRRGSSESALDFDAVLDYLYVYRRHTVVDLELQKNRSALLTAVGMKIDEIFL
jgi:GalNAc5-diNAcBac-PP-undecaprenol beta-1,3-glucosyltransferase